MEEEKKQESYGTLEENLEAIRELIGRMEQDSLSLEASLELYKEGMARLAACEKQIDRVEKELIVLEEG